jgi:hypothetical protein
MSSFKIGGGRRDGVAIEGDVLMIHQRLGGGTIVVPANEIMSVSGYKAILDLPFVEASLVIQTRYHKYVVRRLPKKDRNAAIAAIQALQMRVQQAAKSSPSARETN